MEEIKQKGCYVWGKTREYYYKETKKAVCLECKLSYYSKCKLVKIDGGKIVDHDEADRSIKFVSDVLKAMSDHMKVNKIELVYEGFVDWLREYEVRLHELIKRFEKAAENDSIEEYTEIVTKISSKHHRIFLDTNIF